MLEKFYSLDFFKGWSKDLVARELLAGLTTFMSVCYILFVIPNMLAETGMPKDAALAATIFVTIISTIFMGVYAKFPICVASGLGISAYFTYTICGSLGYTWQTGLGCVLISGIVFLLLTITRLRQAIIDAVPADLKQAIVVGIGLFIAFIGLKGCGIVEHDPATFVRLGDVTNPKTILAVIGFFVTTILLLKKVNAAMFIGILTVSVLAMLFGLQPLPDLAHFTPSLPTVDATFGQFDLKGALGHGLFSIIFSLTIVDLFDNMGCLIALAQKADLVDENDKIKNLNRALFVDSVATILSALFGTTTATTYLESATGIAAGGRTPLTALTIAFLCFIALFYTPLFSCVPIYATSPILVLVGVLMLQGIGKINFSDLSIGIPAFLTIITMPLTFNIATGFGFGFISYVILKLAIGKYREITPCMFVISICFLINFALR